MLKKNTHTNFIYLFNSSIKQLNTLSKYINTPIFSCIRTWTLGRLKTSLHSTMKLNFCKVKIISSCSTNFLPHPSKNTNSYIIILHSSDVFWKYNTHPKISHNIPLYTKLYTFDLYQFEPVTVILKIDST